MKKTILAFHAHPDDVEILAGGTLAQLAAAGHTIAIATMTAGDCGSHQHTPEEIAAIRRSEAANAAARIGASYMCAGFLDLAVFNDDPSRRKVCEILRRAQADIVLTSATVDYMADHEAASSLVRDACFGAPIPNYATGADAPAPVLPAIPHLYYMDPIGGVDRDQRPVEADFYVDVSAVLDLKSELLAEHKSQREWLLQHHGMDNYILQMQRWTRDIGQRAGLAAAEGFRRYKGHPYPQTPLLEDLLRAAGVTLAPGRG